jgi:hypothetical protein
MTYKKSNDNRQLHIDFELYTDGDQNFKIDFISLLIDNLKELLNSLQEAVAQNDIENFRYTVHKVKPTLLIINDDELTALANNISTEDFTFNTESEFAMICKEVIKSLEHECITK